MNIEKSEIVTFFQNRERIDVKMGKIKQLESQLSDKNSEIEGLHEKLEKQEDKNSKLKNNVAKCKEEVKHLNERISHLSKDISDRNKEVIKIPEYQNIIEKLKTYNDLCRKRMGEMDGMLKDKD